LWQRALPILEGLPLSRATEILTHGGLAVAWLRQGDFEGARREADTTLQLIRSSPTTGFVTFEGYVGAAEVYLSLWEAETANAEQPLAQSDMRALALPAVKLLARYARTYPLGRPRAWLYQGWADWLEGAPEAAVRVWRKSLTEATRLQMPYEEGQAHYMLGRHIVGEERLTHLRAASRLFEQLQAAYDVERAQAALAPVWSVEITGRLPSSLTTKPLSP